MGLRNHAVKFTVASARARQADAKRREELAAALKREFEEFERTAREELAARIATLRERAKKDGDNYEALDPPSRAIVDDKLGQEESLEETLEVIEQVSSPPPQRCARRDATRCDACNSPFSSRKRPRRQCLSR